MMVLTDKADVNFPPLDYLSSQSIASRMSAISFVVRAISPHTQSSNEGTHSRAQGVASRDKSGYLSAVNFLAQGLDQLADAIDASLPIAKKIVPPVAATVLVHQS